VLERPSGPGDPVIMEFRIPDRCAEPLTHVHPHNVEVFEVLRGEVELLFGSEWRTIRASESVTVPPGERHTFRKAQLQVRRLPERPRSQPRLRGLPAQAHDAPKRAPRDLPQRARCRRSLRHGGGSVPRPPPARRRAMRVAMPILRTVGRVLRLNVPDRRRTADGHQRRGNMAATGEIRWPPLGRNRWPLTP
jgi:hypothetical protein